MNENHLIKVIGKYKQIFFISPHLDDATISAYKAMEIVSKKRTFTLINVFTKEGEYPYSLSADFFLKSSNYRTHSELFKARIVEDINSLRDLNSKIINLGYIDAIYRKYVSPKSIHSLIPELIHIYPTFRLHIYKKPYSKKDISLVGEIRQKLSEIINPNSDTLLFCPYATKSHPDHCIVKDATKELNCKKIYWLDQPYNINNDSISGFKELVYTSENKMDAIKAYKSQIPKMFGSNMPQDIKEYYLFDNNYYA